MKLLLDQNLSYRLCRPLAPHFEEVLQVRRLGMQESPDTDIWDFARRGGPPKVIYRPLGSAPTGYIETCLLSAVDRIRELGASEDAYLLILTTP